jgi:putative ABC transport system permease protein
VGSDADVGGGSGVILLTLRDLQHRLTRFVIVILLAAVVFALVFVMSGLVEQFHREPVDTVASFGATAWVVPDGVSGPFTAAATMPLDVAAAVDADEHAPVVIARSSVSIGDDDPREVILVGHRAGELGSPRAVDGRPAAAPGEVVVDGTLGVDVGERVGVAGRQFDVVGTSERTTLLAGIPLVFVELSDAQDIVYQSDQVVSVVLVGGDLGSTPPGTVALSDEAVADDAFHPLEGAVSSVNLVLVLLWLMAAVIIGLVVYLSALDRLRDFAVLKAIGTTNRALMAGLAIQAALIAIVAVIVAALLQLLLVPAFPLEVSVPMRAFVQVPLIAIVVALVAAAAGMRKVASSDPALAFAGAGR